MKSFIHCFIFTAVALILGACTNGVEEFRYFSEAYKAQAESGETALDRLAVSERKLLLRKFERSKTDKKTKKAVIPAFNPDEASHIVNLGDPPLTEAIRDSLQSVVRFNEAMTGLATGEAGTTLAARMSDAAVSASGAVGSFGTAAGLQEAAALSGAMKGAVELIKPLFEQLAQIEDRARFRTLLIEAYPNVRKMMIGLRAGTTTMFKIHKRAYVTRGALGGQVEGVLLTDLPELEKERMRLAEWVLLLDKAMIAMDEAFLAVKANNVNPTSLVATSQELSQLAETIKRFRNQN